MKRLCRVLLLLCIPGLLLAGYDPFNDGALADVRVRVVDDQGAAVTGATVSLVFYVAPEKVDVAKGATDANGEFAAARNCIGEFHVWARKAGYYDTTLEPAFRDVPPETTIKTRRWSNGTVRMAVILKKIRYPVRLDRHGAPSNAIPYPATNTVMGFDLQALAWCPPYGNGKHDDLQFLREFWRSPTNWLQVYEKIVITATNALDGFYFAPIDKSSALRTCYHADTNAVYAKSIELEYDRRTGKVIRNVALPKDRYLVFRMRTKIDTQENLLSANYGFLAEGFDPSMDLTIRSAFNPAANDTNLEDARP